MPTVTLPLTVAPCAGVEKPAVSCEEPFWTVTGMLPVPVLLLGSRTAGTYALPVHAALPFPGAIPRRAPRVGVRRARRDLGAVDGECVGVGCGPAARRHAHRDTAADGGAGGGAAERGAELRAAGLDGDGAGGGGSGAGVVTHGETERVVATGVSRRGPRVGVRRARRDL